MRSPQIPPFCQLPFSMRGQNCPLVLATLSLITLALLLANATSVYAGSGHCGTYLADYYLRVNGQPIGDPGYEWVATVRAGKVVTFTSFYDISIGGDYYYDLIEWNGSGVFIFGDGAQETVPFTLKVWKEEQPDDRTYDSVTFCVTHTYEKPGEYPVEFYFPAGTTTYACDYLDRCVSGTFEYPVNVRGGTVVVEPVPTVKLAADLHEVWANGHEEAELIALATNENGLPLPGRVIQLRADPPDGVVIKPSLSQTSTDVDGKVYFTVTSTELGAVTFIANDLEDPKRKDTTGLNFIQRRVAVFVQGIATIYAPGRASTIFPKIRETLVGKGFSRPAKEAPETGVQCTNAVDDDGDGVPDDGCPLILYYSYTGGRVDLDTGIWVSNSYRCNRTGQSIFAESIPKLEQMIREFAGENPNTRFVIIGHSQGGLIALRGAEVFFGNPDVPVDAIITLDGALGGVPPLHALIAKVFQCWEDPAGADMVALWETATDHTKQGTTAGNNSTLVLNAVGGGTNVVNIGSVDDCVFNPMKCGVNGGLDNTSTQLIEVANGGLGSFAGNCSRIVMFRGKEYTIPSSKCIRDSHSNVLEDPQVLEIISDAVGEPTIP